MAADLHYVPMPAPVIEIVRSEWKSKLKSAAGQPVY
jgi:hypothetical protein